MLLCNERYFASLTLLFARYDLTLVRVADSDKIPGCYWGEPEAGLVGNTVHARTDTPVHSVLHEASHVICMDPPRRKRLHTDAGGEFIEEDAVCYLQIILAGLIGLSRESICADMDEWGYTFRLGSAQEWFRQDADDAYAWLVQHDIMLSSGTPTYRMRSV